LDFGGIRPPESGAVSIGVVLDKRMSLIIAATAWCMGSALDSRTTAQTGADMLSAGVVIHGDATFEKEGDALQFFVNRRMDVSAALSATIRLSPRFAMDKKYVSAALYSRLSPGGPVTIRIADAAPLKIGTALDEELLTGTVQCSAPELIIRNDRYASYGLSCLNIYEELRARSANGNLAREVVMVVTAPNLSAVDQFLAQRLLVDTANKPILVRIER
jgi:hypothetical protein